MMLESDRRKEASKNVKLVFTTSNNFQVLDDDKNVKYSGSIIPSSCSCESFKWLNPDKHMDSHGVLALCKHLYHAAEVKKVQDSQENRLRDSIKRRKDSQVVHGKLPKGWQRYDY